MDLPKQGKREADPMHFCDGSEVVQVQRKPGLRNERFENTGRLQYSFNRGTHWLFGISIAEC